MTLLLHRSLEDIKMNVCASQRAQCRSSYSRFVFGHKMWPSADAGIYSMWRGLTPSLRESVYRWVYSVTWTLSANWHDVTSFGIHWLIIKWCIGFLSPFCQVAGEVLAKADDTPVLSIIDPIESICMGQGHLWKYKEHLFYIIHYIFIFWPHFAPATFVSSETHSKLLMFVVVGGWVLCSRTL